VALTLRKRKGTARLLRGREGKIPEVSHERQKKGGKKDGKSNGGEVTVFVSSTARCTKKRGERVRNPPYKKAASSGGGGKGKKKRGC